MVAAMLDLYATSMKTAIDQDIGTSGIGSGITKEVHRGAHQVVTIAYALQGRGSVHQVHQVWMILAQSLGHVGFGVAGGNGVDRDPLRCQLDAQGGGQHLDSAFGGVVGGQAMAWDRTMCTDGGNEDQATSSALLFHLLGSKLSGEESAIDLTRVRIGIGPVGTNMVGSH